MPAWRPDFLSLKLFIAVCEENSISRAAERESIAPSAVSKRIAEIEELTGVPLLTRGNRGVRPTLAGSSFLHHARQILLNTEKLQSEMGDYAQGAKGHVRIYANASSIIQFLPQDIGSFLKQHPPIKVDLQERTSSEVVQAITESEVDIGVCLGNVRAEGLELLPYATDNLVVVAHSDHPLTRHASVSFSDTLNYDFISLQANSRTTSFLRSQAAHYGQTLNFRSHVNSLEAVLYLIAENLGIAILAMGATQILKGSLGLKAIPLTDKWAQREIKIYLRSYEALARPSRLFIDHLSEQSHGRRQTRQQNR